MSGPNIFDVLVIGGGQSGLALGYYLRRSELTYKILDKEESAGGSWQHFWESLQLFSPAQWSSLPGTLMQGGPDYYPGRNETIEYLKGYEEKYKIPVERSVHIEKVEQAEEGIIKLYTNKGVWMSRALISATGSFSNPYIPEIPGKDTFKGKILHSSQYRAPGQFRNKKVVVVGGGNSGTQILAELSRVAHTLWVTEKPPRFLPDEVDGRTLFDAATEMYKARQEGRSFTPPSLGDIVMVPSVKEARFRGVLKWNPPIKAFTEEGVILENGKSIAADAVVFCTGFRASLAHLESLGIVENGKVKTNGTQAETIKGLWLVGYGNWTGFASSTLIGVGRSARKTVQEVETYLAHNG
ncbi:ArsO family NAD(P)H-dependent flavin-containing monooxygenase [Nafulsella turpanensis]|uniref:ArsO family NAD(P)H-dependent flavin-containing monooxygenase n=1 Tax=Nafulsella turpanensis TaxID=1265690 RepID=UPI0003459559|nr:ArsO family NAD(P)H-dependent flavin-containing monooxygenase [Nafulsella turpanensis]